uniref:Exoribonuclease phosphorolytic domain-containing protein n=1 Tax=Timema tahoe TaxID=61484 RepID=A0A7R9IJ69_9NEOP|nr:unnamed protein product [Timema tahoe]
MSPSLPVCVSYALFNNGTVVVADPTALEERVSEAQIVFGMNAYRELCGLHLGGSALATFETVVNCAIRAGNRAAQVVQKIKTLLAQDAETRAAGKPVGFTDCICQTNVLALSQDRLAIRLHRRDLRETARNLVSVRTGRADRSNLLSMDEDEPTLLSLGNGSAELIPSRSKYPQGKLGDKPVVLGGPSKWEQHNSSKLSDSEEEEKGTLYPGDLERPGGREQQKSDMASNKNQASESDDSTSTRSCILYYLMSPERERSSRLSRIRAETVLVVQFVAVCLHHVEEKVYGFFLNDWYRFEVFH